MNMVMQYSGELQLKGYHLLESSHDSQVRESGSWSREREEGVEDPEKAEMP